jgi:hypothetical protein
LVTPAAVEQQIEKMWWYGIGSQRQRSCTCPTLHDLLYDPAGLVLVSCQRASLVEELFTMNPVYFYVPNLIGYGRIIAAIVAFIYAFSNHIVFLWLYAISYTLDALDGIAARKLNQCMSSPA